MAMVIEVVSIIGAILTGSFGLLSGVTLLYGAIKYNISSVMINLVVSAIWIFFIAVTAIFMFAVANHPNLHQNRGTKYSAQETEEIFIGAGSVYVLVTIIDVYLWSCVYSFFQSLKAYGYIGPDE